MPCFFSHFAPPFTLAIFADRHTVNIHLILYIMSFPFFSHIITARILVQFFTLCSAVRFHIGYDDRNDLHVYVIFCLG